MKTRIKNTPKTGTFPDALDRAVENTRAYLLSIQHPDGYWKGKLEADASVSAGYITLQHFLELPLEPARVKKIVRTMKAKQNEDGSWGAYQGGAGDISVTAQVYFALKLAGESADESCLQRARKFVVSRGGLMKTNIITRIWLALFGEWDWTGIPSIPPELILLPSWFYLNIYECSSWARATMMALAILTVEKPVCRIPESARISELYAEPEKDRNYAIGTSQGTFTWENFFLTMDRIFKKYEKLPVNPVRRLAMRKTADWITQHQEQDGSWGGIMLPWIYSLFALKTVGYPQDHPVMKKGIEGLEDFIVEDDDDFLLEPATSPVWDTAWSVLALRESGLPETRPELVSATKWLLGKEIRRRGDWWVKNPGITPGGWSFEFCNEWYPDIDDTAVVPRALMSVTLPEREEEEAKNGAIERGAEWVAEMQGDNGGWAAFDRNNHRPMLAHIPFSDFITPLDPVSPDVTNHVIELLCRFDGVYDKELEKGIAYLRECQEADGAWYGRWGVNYIYGTGLVLPSLQAAGENMNTDYIQKAAKWLLRHQHADGGWGESCRTYDEPVSRGEGESSASQTAWALMGLIAAGKARSEAVRKGISYLMDTQQRDGSWQEETFTGTGFPRAFYLRYDLYRIYFPLMALSRYRNAIQEAAS